MSKSGGPKAARRILNRIRKPADRVAIFSWIGAAVADYEQQASIHNADPPIFDILLKGMGIPRSAFAPPKVDLDRLPISLFHQTLTTANHEELEQARRDWQAINELIRAVESTDWNVAGSELEAKIEALTKSRPEPPSKRHRKTSRQRPYAKPAVVDLFLSGFQDFNTRPYLLALFIGIRRSSRENSTVLTQAIVLAEAFVSGLPRRTEDTTPSEPAR